MLVPLVNTQMFHKDACHNAKIIPWRKHTVKWLGRNLMKAARTTQMSPAFKPRHPVTRQKAQPWGSSFICGPLDAALVAVGGAEHHLLGPLGKLCAMSWPNGTIESQKYLRVYLLQAYLSGRGLHSLVTLGTPRKLHRFADGSVMSIR